MSYALYPYLITPSTVSTVYGCQDELLRNEFTQKYKQKIQALRDFADSEYSPIEALKDIFEGRKKMPIENDTEVHAHLCELLCDHLGQVLVNTEWKSLNMSWLMDINMPPSLPLLDLTPPHNFPYVLTILQKNLDNFVEQMGALVIEEKAWEQFESWVNQANQKKQDLVLFFY